MELVGQSPSGHISDSLCNAWLAEFAQLVGERWRKPCNFVSEAKPTENHMV
jgi:hypothetical protein